MSESRTATRGRDFDQRLKTEDYFRFHTEVKQLRRAAAAESASDDRRYRIRSCGKEIEFVL